MITHLQKAKFIQKASDIANNLRPDNEFLPNGDVHNKVKIPLTIPSFLHKTVSKMEQRQKTS